MTPRFTGRKQLAHAPLLFAVFLDLTGFGMVIPDVQTRLESFGAGGWGIGAVLSSYFLVQVVASPLWGRASDRWGRKPVLVVCGALSALSMLAYAVAESLPFVLLSRALAGLAAANVVVAQAYIADATHEQDEGARTAAMGRIGAATTAGLVLGPALGGWLAHLGGNLLLGLAAAGASGLGALWVLAAVAPVPPSRKLRAGGRPVLDLSLLRDVPRLRPLFTVAAALFFALACLEGTFGRLIRHNLGLGPKEFGLIFGYESVVSVAVQSLLLARVTARFHSRLLLGGACLLQAAGLALTPYAPCLLALFGLSTVYAAGAGFATPTLNSLCSEATPEPRQGEMFGLLQAARSFGFLLGPLLGSVLFDWRVQAPYLLAGAVLTLVALGVFFSSGKAAGRSDN